jgi:ribosome maturation factor RimP
LDENIHLEVREKARKKVIVFPLKDVDKARLAIQF